MHFFAGTGFIVPSAGKGEDCHLHEVSEAGNCYLDLPGLFRLVHCIAGLVVFIYQRLGMEKICHLKSFLK